mmetsp:Transcript_16093/g.22220  ORF Transcript_16093/g.22220 Transcript_16093/m.22220 type:complete len:417 (+) Transcript_16093:38-1288(+)|eukprot:CAMPEP_0196593158 /NCGR_PEP_ID=MMETSP1081-20130531/74838_1 /TAXON_ID=36882 /ORGANISM="Pyramimonas amylifera, Strain CCMP720" /LENGTH=416 /DNA_ID=CAMNT_0041917053 /DNA_START=42 /DNA_END=1292 /DNA_ORIENTATION=-
MAMVPVVAEDAKELLTVGRRLGLDPIRDMDLIWIAKEYLSAPLPQDWRMIRAPNGEVHYVNAKMRYDVLTNPIEPRFRKLVEVIKDSQVNQLPLDEVTVLEIIDPIERAADVKDMCEYQGIDFRKDVHLLWVAKLAVLETMPSGWEEYIDTAGRTMYRNVLEGFSTEEHPADAYFQDLLKRQRAKREPYFSIQLKYFNKPVTHYRNDLNGTLRTEVEPAAGNFVPFYDLYGQRYWFNMVTERITTDLKEVREAPAALTIQRVWRGYTWRRRLWELHDASKHIAVTWHTFEYRKAYRAVNLSRAAAALRVQKYWRMRTNMIAASQEVFVHLAEEGARCRRLNRIQGRTAGLQATGHTFLNVRKKVILIQRCWRMKLQRILISQMKTRPPHDHDSYIVTHAANTIQDAFRGLKGMKIA